MLTATYTLIALSVEQASVKLSLTAIQDYVKSNCQQAAALAPAQVDQLGNMLDQVYRACQWRKIDMFLVPAIRSSGERADQLLDELHVLNDVASGALDAVHVGLRNCASEIEQQVLQVTDCIDTFCGALLTCIEKEELELFPLACSMISSVTWFSIANQILLHDARTRENRRNHVPTVPTVAPVVSAERRARRSAPGATPAFMLARGGAINDGAAACPA